MSHVAQSSLPLTNTQVAGGLCWSCGSCDNAKTPMLRCGKCRRGRYCSKVCQIANWQNGHKRLCKQLCALNAIDASRGHFSHTWDEYRSDQARRLLIFNEVPKVVILAQPRCSVCYRLPSQSPAWIPLTPCKLCPLAFTCSDCESKFDDYHNVDWCEILYQVAAVERVILIWERTNPGEYRAPRGCSIPSSSHTSFEGLSWSQLGELQWYNWSTRVQETGLRLGFSGTTSIEAISMIMKEPFSGALTLLNALEEVLPDIRAVSNLTIHVIDAGSREIREQDAMEELLHLLPSLKVLTMVYIGRVFPPQRDEADTACNMACDQCQEAGRIRTTRAYGGTYQDFLSKPIFHTHPPDIVCGFNIDAQLPRISLDDRRATMSSIVARGIPAMFTVESKRGWSEELKILRQVGARLLGGQGARNNPWSGDIAHLQHSEAEEEHALHMTNQFWYLIKGPDSTIKNDC